MTSFRTTFAVLLLAITGAVDLSASDAVPLDVQIPLFTKIWTLDREFSGRIPTTVAVVYQEKYGPSARIYAQLLALQGAKAHAVRWIPVAIDGPSGLDPLHTVVADVFYVAPLRGANIAIIAAIARERRIRTNTGTPEYVDAGLSVAIDVRGDRPLIVINVAASKAEGASFPAQLLQIARLVGTVR
jgi:YfiR/HmsC-like